MSRWFWDHKMDFFVSHCIFKYLFIVRAEIMKVSVLLDFPKTKSYFSLPCWIGYWWLCSTFFHVFRSVMRWGSCRAHWRNWPLKAAVVVVGVFFPDHGLKVWMLWTKFRLSEAFWLTQIKPKVSSIYLYEFTCLASCSTISSILFLISLSLVKTFCHFLPLLWQSSKNSDEALIIALEVILKSVPRSWTFLKNWSVCFKLCLT